MRPEVYRYEVIVVDRVVELNHPGNFALGEKDDSGEFVPKYVGRSDVDLNGELKRRKGDLGYTFFKFSLSSPKDAFDMECAHFHTFRGQLDNTVHPARPDGTDLLCMICGN
jgi:hypothetical protein